MDLASSKNQSKGHLVRCMNGRYGAYVLIDDLQKMLYRDAVNLAKDGELQTADYVERFALNLDKLKD